LRIQREALEQSERFRNIAGPAPVMIWVSGPDKPCTFFDKVWLQLTGRTMEEELGLDWDKRVHPDDLDRCLTGYSASFDARAAFQLEYRVRRKDGEYRWVLDKGVPLVTPMGVFNGYVGSCTDITEIKRDQEEALDRQRLESVGRVARWIAHDFNNLLGGILATTELVLSEGVEGSLAGEDLMAIRAAAIRGGEIVGHLMTYSAEDSSAFEPVDLSLLVSGIRLPSAGQPGPLSRDVPVLSSADGEAVGSTGTVLVVEDEDTLRLAVSRMLRKKGFSVMEAIDGPSAMDLFRARERDIDVVLLDTTLPGMTGSEVLAQLRRIRPTMKVIVTSAYSPEISAVSGQPSCAFIRKPYQLNDLWNLVGAACREEGMSAHAN
jgi:PAS domain S-box-containing protein